MYCLRFYLRIRLCNNHTGDSILPVSFTVYLLSDLSLSFPAYLQPPFVLAGGLQCRGCTYSPPVPPSTSEGSRFTTGCFQLRLTPLLYKGRVFQPTLLTAPYLQHALWLLHEGIQKCVGNVMDFCLVTCLFGILHCQRVSALRCLIQSLMSL